MVKNSPSNAEDIVRDTGSILGSGRSLEEEMAIHSSNFAWKIPGTEGPVGYSPWGHKKSDRTEGLSTQHTQHILLPLLFILILIAPDLASRSLFRLASVSIGASLSLSVFLFSDTTSRHNLFFVTCDPGRISCFPKIRASNFFKERTFDSLLLH